MSEEVLKSYKVTIDGEELEFTDKAIEEIKQANADTDDIENQIFESKAHFHFDNEKLYKGSYRVREQKRLSVTRLDGAEPDGEEARQYLGGGMHTLQDFYAHSNWVNFNDVIHPDLGETTILNPSPNTRFCPNDVGTLEGPGFNSVTTGYFVMPAACLLLITNPPLAYLCARSYCNDIPIPGKCRHGIEYTGCAGINKDELGRPLFGKARALAKEASHKYLNSLVNDPAITGNENRLEMVKALMGIENGDLVIVVDDTGSMGNDIAQVKNQIANIVNDAGIKPGRYILVRFGDPTIGTPFITTDTAAFLARVNALYPSGGGDCPELSMGALLKAVRASRKNSNIFLFTDADAKDAGLVTTVSTEAKAGDKVIYPVLTGSCSRRRRSRTLQTSEEIVRPRRKLAEDPVYQQVALDTGGQVFSVGRSDVGAIFDFLRFQLSGNFFTVLSKALFHESSSDTTSLNIPIDSSIDSILVSVATERTSFDVALRRPDNSIVTSSDANVTITEQSRGIFYAIEDPTPGLWTIDTTVLGEFDILVRGKGSIQFPSFSFVTPKLTYGGLVYRPIVGQPIIGSSPAGLARLTGSYSKAEFRLIDVNGAYVDDLDFSQGSDLASADSWSGNITLPSIGFRIEACGEDENGLFFSRIYPELFYGRDVGMSIDANNTASPHLPYNQSLTTIEFVVTNHDLSSPKTFMMGASNDKDLPMTLLQSYLTIGANGTATFGLTIESPPADDCVQDMNVLITVTATSTTDSTVTNSISVTRFTDCDFALVEDDPTWFSDPVNPEPKKSKKSSKSSKAGAEHTMTPKVRRQRKVV